MLTIAWVAATIVGLVLVVWGLIKGFGTASVVMILVGLLLLIAVVVTAFIAVRHRPAEGDSPGRTGPAPDGPEPLTPADRERISNDLARGATQQANDAMLRKIERGTESATEPSSSRPHEQLARTIAAGVVARKTLTEDLSRELTAGRRLLDPIDMPKYAMAHGEARNIQTGATERWVRDWARGLRVRLKDDPGLVKRFDRGADLPHETLSAAFGLGGTATHEQLVEFLQDKVANLEDIIQGLSP
jgi:hypothetical protein